MRPRGQSIRRAFLPHGLREAATRAHLEPMPPRLRRRGERENRENGRQPPKALYPPAPGTPREQTPDILRDFPNSRGAFDALPFLY